MTRFMVNSARMPFPYDEFDLSDVRTYPLASRASKARIEQFARPRGPDRSVASLIASLPDILAGADFKAVVGAIAAARRDEGGILWGVGAHVVKTGLGPI